MCFFRNKKKKHGRIQRGTERPAPLEMGMGGGRGFMTTYFGHQCISQRTESNWTLLLEEVRTSVSKENSHLWFSRGWGCGGEHLSPPLDPPVDRESTIKSKHTEFCELDEPHAGFFYPTRKTRVGSPSALRPRNSYFQTARCVEFHHFPAG